MELYASEDINDIQNQNKANKQATNLNKTNCGPFRPHKINNTIKYSHGKKSNIGQNSKSNEVHTWTALVAIALFVSSVLFPDKFSSNAYCSKKNLLKSAPNPPTRALPPRKILSSLFLFSPIYITPQDLNFFPKKRKILLFPFFFSSFFLNLPIKSNLPNFKFPSKTFQGESHFL